MTDFYWFVGVTLGLIIGWIAGYHQGIRHGAECWEQHPEWGPAFVRGLMFLPKWMRP